MTARFSTIFPVLFFLSLVACGGRQPVTITSESVFSMEMSGQVWEFQNGYRATNQIKLESPQALTRLNDDGTVTEVTWNDTSAVAGRAGNNIVMHFANKSTDCTYWSLCVHNAELWFPLHQNADGSWRSTSSLINMRDGCPWCPAGPFILTSQVIDNQPGMSLPYLIAPPTITAGEHLVNETRVCAGSAPGLTYDNTIPEDSLCGPMDGEYWRTDFYIADVSTPVYSGPAIVSDQYEGTCGHELWYWAPGWGIVKIESPYDGGEIKGNPICANWGLPETHDPKLTIERIE